jgi:fructoselysine-6-P-deglycase FrlB-like protein
VSDPSAFRADLDAVPQRLAELARALGEGPPRWSLPAPPRRLLLTGMGSSCYAAQVAALRLRSLGFDAVAELSSVRSSWPADPELVVVAISASGRSAETLRFAERHRGTSRVVALTNEPGSPLAELADTTVELLAGPELGGVACRTYRHTLAALAELERSLGGDVDPGLALRRAAAASAHLLDRVEAWLPPVLDALAAGDGTWFLAPVERIGSALQGALMLREGPRRLADGCETGDWSHVDVYLTKTLDYRAVVFAGSPWDAAALGWMHERARPFVSVGADLEGAAATVRYPHDDDPLVAALTEVLVAELVAHAWWAR